MIILKKKLVVRGVVFFLDIELVIYSIFTCFIPALLLFLKVLLLVGSVDGFELYLNINARSSCP